LGRTKEDCLLEQKTYKGDMGKEKKMKVEWVRCCRILA